MSSELIDAINAMDERICTRLDNLISMMAGQMPLEAPQTGATPATQADEGTTSAAVHRTVKSSRNAFCQCECQCWRTFEDRLEQPNVPSCCSCEMDAYRGEGTEPCGCRPRQGEWLIKDNNKKYRWARS